MLPLKMEVHNTKSEVIRHCFMQTSSVLKENHAEADKNLLNYCTLKTVLFTFHY